jgi:branched-chain amino acid transport system ATP-binding protein
VARADGVSALVFEDVHASYGPYKALNGLTLNVGDDETVALLGRNGVGKSTLVRVASGIVPVTSGTLAVLGRKVRRTAAHVLARDGVVHLPEGVGLFAGLSIEENLVLRVGGATRAQRGSRLSNALDGLGPSLRARRRAKAGQLSGGQQRLVAVAAAIAAEPRLLLCDEPALGLSPGAADEVYAALLTARSSSRAMVIVETRLDRAAKLCERAVVLDAGAVAYDSTTSDAAGITSALLGVRGAA